MIIFATIFGAGFVVLLLSLIFGHDVDADVDVSTDVDGGSHGPSVFSIKMLALLAVGFGAVGYGFRTTTDWTMFQSSMAGVGGAAVVGLLGWLMLRLFYSSQASSTITDRDLLGSTGNTIDAIVENGYGQILCVVMGREITFMARSEDGGTIERRTPVKIVGKAGNIVTVRSLRPTKND